MTAAISLSKISLADLAKTKTELKFTKTGKEGGAKGPYVDPFTLDVSFPVEFTAEEVTESPNGSPQLALSVSIIQEDGTLKKAGKVWINLIDITAPTESQNKDGEKLGRFLRAVDPTNFSVYASIDKSGSDWKYIDHEGNEMTGAEREARGADIDTAVVNASEGLLAGTLSVVGMRCYIQKVRNPKSEKYPFVNFLAEPRA